MEKYSLCSAPSSPRIVLCLELKFPTLPEAIAKTHSELANAGMGEESVYFDSFFGDKLDLVSEKYAKSLHLWARFGLSQGRVTSPKYGYDLITVPRAMAFGEPTEPTIYGAVGSVEEIEKAADNPLVLGVYARIEEKNPVKMFMKSLKR